MVKDAIRRRSPSLMSDMHKYTERARSVEASRSVEAAEGLREQLARGAPLAQVRPLHQYVFLKKDVISATPTHPEGISSCRYHAILLPP